MGQTTRSLGKTTDLINLAMGIGKHMTVAAVYRNHLSRGGDFCPAEAAAKKFPLVTVFGLFITTVVYFAIKKKFSLLPEKKTGIDPAGAGKSALNKSAPQHDRLFNSDEKAAIAAHFYQQHNRIGPRRTPCR